VGNRSRIRKSGVFLVELSIFSSSDVNHYAKSLIKSIDNYKILGVFGKGGIGTESENSLDRWNGLRI